MNNSVLKELVNINSDSANSKGIRACMDILIRHASSLGLKSDLLKSDTDNPILKVISGKERSKRLLLVGHVDTVFAENWGSFTSADGILRGPGVQDMKAGLMMMFALARKFRDDPLIELTLLINSDEEIGSLNSIEIFRETAAVCDMGLVFEGVAREIGFIVKRKGIAEFHLYSKGVASHAGNAFHQGRNAIVELMQAVRSILEEASGLPKKVTLNLGKFLGGGKLNIVPDHAEAHFDLRYSQILQFDKVLEIFQKHISDMKTLTLEYKNKRPSMEPAVPDEISARLSRLFKQHGEPHEPASSGGCSDGNFLSSFGIPVLDGFGPRGGGDHTSDEFTIEASIGNRINALFDFINMLAE